MKGIIQDKQTGLIQEVYAVLYSPKKQGRKRYPENCVSIVEDKKTAVKQSKPDQHFYAAKVLGPARSSEGFRLYYLVEWIS